MSNQSEDLQSASNPSGPTNFGRYTHLKFIGKGGMATVFQAHDPLLNRTIALKLVTAEFPAVAERLAREARAQAKVDHAHICKVYDVGELEGRSYIAMQYIAGRTLNEAATEMSLLQKVTIMAQVSDALHNAHQAGLIHRDLKPENIMVEKKEDGSWEPFVVDFGLAREMAVPGLTLSGFAMGTPAYMSPEQARGDVAHIAKQSDIYNIGATLYELMAGKPPFQADNFAGVILNILEKEPASLRKAGVPSDLETIILKCLEKEPARRYESARALADDLRLFIKGEPIHARPATLIYRIKKKIRKNWAVAAIAAAASLAILLVAGFAAYTSWQSQEQERLANDFGQELQYIEQRLRHMYTADLHDIRKEKAQIKDRLEQVKARMRREGEIAYGPGLYVLGQGHLILNENERARAFLEQAWSKYDYKLPQVAFAQGLTLAMLYRQQLSRAEQIVLPEQREARKKELEKEFRDPALRYIREGRTATQPAEFVEALIAFLENRNDDALKKTGIAFKKVPWFYESRILYSEILLAKAREKQRTGAIEDALKLFGEAEEGYSSVIAKAPSEIEAYLGMASTQGDIVFLLIYHTDLSPKAHYEKGKEACQNGLRINPDDANLYIQNSNLVHLWGEYLIRTGRDAEPVMLEASELAEKALSLAPDNPMASDALGMTCNNLASYYMNQGKDPNPLLDKAIRAFQKGLATNPRQASILGHLGNAYSLKARAAFYRGQDPTPFSNKAIENFEKSLMISPDVVGVQSNLCHQLGFLGNVQMETGSDPRPFYDRAVSHCEQAMKLNPRWADAATAAGAIYYWKGKYESLHGQNPGKSLALAAENYRKKMDLKPSAPESYADLCESLNLEAEHSIKVQLDAQSAIDEAIRSCNKAVELDPGSDFSQLNLGIAYLNLAEMNLNKKRNPIVPLQHAQGTLRLALKINPEYPDVYLAMARVAYLQAKWNAAQDRSLEAELKASRKAIEDSLRINSRYAEAFLLNAALDGFESEQLIAKNRPATSVIDSGIRHADKALSLNPEFYEAEAVKGTLYTLQARLEKAAVSRQNAARKAEALLKNAIDSNGNLNRLYGPFLLEAREIIAQHPANR